MCDGRSESDCMIASPRKMCVPGVHASAVEGVRAIATAATSIAARKKEPGPRERGPVATSDADALALTADCLSKIVELVFDNVVDCIACCVHVIANLLSDVIHWDAIDQLFTALCGDSHSLCCARTGPACSASCTVSSPARAFKAILACDARALSCSAKHWAERP